MRFAVKMNTGNQPRGRGLLRNAARCSATMTMLCVLATGCSTLQAAPPNPADMQRLAEVRAIAGPPVTSFRFMQMSSFEPIGLADVLVFTTPREAWLLHLDGQCRNLDFDPFVGLTSHMHRVSSGFDSVIVRDNPIPCRIEQIRPIDASVLRRIDREKKARNQPAGDAPPAPVGGS
jgi:hypothetical protein